MTNKIDSCVNFDCVFNRLSKKNREENFIKNLNRIPFLNQSLEFRFQFINELSKTKFSYFQNVSFSQAQSLSFFIKHKPFVVLESDKNVGACLITQPLCNSLALDCLSDTSIYIKLDSDPLNDIKTRIESSLIV